MSKINNFRIIFLFRFFWKLWAILEISIAIIVWLLATTRVTSMLKFWLISAWLGLSIEVYEIYLQKWKDLKTAKIERT